MSNQERTSALIRKGSNKTDGDRTYIVFGSMRGGTTMVSGLMQALGVFMGDDIDENNQESMSFNSRPIPFMRDKLGELNEQHSVWGWKYPHAADYLNNIWGHIRNPHLICVFRDSVANARGLSRWHPIGNFHAVQENALRQQKNINLLSVRGCPSLLVSYEKAQRNPRQFVTELAEWVGVEPNFDKFDYDAFCAAESYKKLHEYFR